MMKKQLGIIILNWNGTIDTLECLKSLDLTNYFYFILDNGSKIEQYNLLINEIENNHISFKLATLENIKLEISDAVNIYIIRSEENYGFAMGNNLVAQQIKDIFDYILLLNNDTVVTPGTFESMISTLTENNLTAVTCDIRYYSNKNKLWDAGGNFKWYGDKKNFTPKKIDCLIKKGTKYIEAEYITGCAMLVACDYIREFGLFSSDFFHGEEDYNFCYLAKKRKKRIGVDLTHKIYHKVGRSLNPNKDNEKTTRSIIVHYTNRCVDYKKIYSKFHWKIWRTMYLTLLFTYWVCKKMKLSKAKFIIKKVKYFSGKYDNVCKDVFTEIMNLEIKK